MDDFEHSVLISEQDWYSFYEESEECCIQQARLADLDNLGLSDTDDEKNSTQSGNPLQPVISLQTSPSNEEDGAAAQTLCKADGCEMGNPTEDSEFSYKMDLEQTEGILTSDSNVNVNNPESQQNIFSHTKNSKENDQVQSEDKLGQVMDEPITTISSSSTQDTGHGASSEGETITKVTESSATPKTEKERWFVTVNESPVHQRVQSGMMSQKKRRKKKSSRKLGHQSRVIGGQCPHSKNEKEAEGKEITKRQKEQDEFKQLNQKCFKHLYFNGVPDNEDAISGPNIIQEVNVSPVEEPEEEHCEKSSPLKTNCTSFAESSISEGQNDSFKHKGTDVPTEDPEKNPSASVHSSSFMLMHLHANFQCSFRTQLANDQSMSNQAKKNTDITTQNLPVTNSSLIHDDPKENDSRLILRTLSTTASSDELYHQQEHLTQSQHEQNISSLQETQNQEPLHKSLDPAIGPSHPIYALSSFWDEMERLTINDILHLRVANNRSLLSECVNPDESNFLLGDGNLLDSKNSSLRESCLADEAADSDYFTQVDDSKPEHSSCEFSSLSDFDEEFQIINTSTNPSPEPQSVKEQTESSLKSTYISELLPEQEPYLTTVNNDSVSEDILMLCPQHGMPLYLYPATEAQSLLLTCEMNSDRNPFELEDIKKTPSSVLSVDNTLDYQCSQRSSFSEIFAKDVDGEELRTRTPDRCSPVVSVYSSKYLSVPETYDDFFSDFVVGNLFFPSIQDQTVPVPIFSSSCSVVRDLVFPEAWELIESDFKEVNSPIQVMTRFSNQLERSTSPSGTANIYLFPNQRSNWRSLLSLRRIRFIGKWSTWWRKVSSWMFPQEAKDFPSYVSSAQPMPHLYHTGNNAPISLVEQQNYVQHNASISKSFLFSIKQADICLVCIAFASWVLKSSNPQSTDMWKAALLANVSAISAIQYLRKYVKKEEIDDDPQSLLL